jgi:transposase
MSQGKRLSDEHLREVARVYNYALESRTLVQVHGFMQKAVMKHFDIPLSTAAKQIMQARKRGFILTAKELKNQLKQDKLQREYDKAKETIDRLSLVVTTDNMKS